MAGCDGWITIKVFELLGAIFCMIYKRVTDDEANKLFYFLQKYSREWPLLNNVTWEENGAIFADITYGSYIIIVIGLIIAQCSGELQRHRKLENFFLLVGALLFIGAGSLELAALDSVEERLVDNAAILGVVSLITGFLFIIDFLTAGKRRKREKLKILQKMTISKLTQTEGKCPNCQSPTAITTMVATDVNGNVQNDLSHDHGGSRIPKNAVKLLPSSPELSEYLLTSEKPTNYPYLESGNYFKQPPDIDENDLKTHEGRIRSTESFLRSEKGLYPKIHKRTDLDRSNSQFFIPAGYVLVPADHFQARSPTLKSDSGIGESYTPPGYAHIAPGPKYKSKKEPTQYVISVDEDYPRKTQSGRAKSMEYSTTSRESHSPNERGSGSRSSHYRSSSYKRNSSETSDLEDSKPNQDRYHEYDEKHTRTTKRHSEYTQTNSRTYKYVLPSEESSDEQKPDYHNGDAYSRPGSRASQRSKDWNYMHEGKTNDGYSDEKDNFSGRATPYHSSTTVSSHEKPKSILRFDYPSKKETVLHFPKDVQYNSLDGKKIAQDLRTLKEITKSDLDLSRNRVPEKRDHSSGNRKWDLQEDDDEKDRRMSEREEQYFGLKDLKQSHKERKFQPLTTIVQKRTNPKEDIQAAKEEQDYRDLIDEKFYFLHEEDKKKPGIKGVSKQRSDSDDTNYSPSTDEEIRLRVETPGSASYKSEAMVWVDNHRETQTRPSTPISPTSPGYVLYTAQNWPESPSPQDRFQFNAREAQQLSINMPPKTPLLDRLKSDFSSLEETVKNSHKSRLLDFEEPSDSGRASRQRGLLVRKVDHPNQPITEHKKPSAVAGSTSTWKKWLQPKPKLIPTKSAPN